MFEKILAFAVNVVSLWAGLLIAVVLIIVTVVVVSELLGNK